MSREIETDKRRQIESNLIKVKQQIANAAQQSGRDARDVKLVAVTKYVDAETTGWLFDCGCENIGESRPQELWDKADQLADRPIIWHLVGHLQRNKVKRTLAYVQMIHSVDSIRLAAAIDRHALELDRSIDVLLEVNVSGDLAKHGFQPSELKDSIESICELPQLNVRGLMCMAGLGHDPDATRREFASLREMRDELSRVAPTSAIRELSMGMSADFEIAVQEGATIVRIGTVLFAGIL